MNKLFGYADAYMKQSDWKDLALIKTCLFSLGILFGMTLPKKAQKPIAAVASTAFIATYIPLMLKLFHTMCITREEKF